MSTISEDSTSRGDAGAGQDAVTSPSSTNGILDGANGPSFSDMQEDPLQFDGAGVERSSDDVGRDTIRAEEPDATNDVS